MTIPVVPFENPDQSLIDLPRVDNPYLSIWWTAQTVSGVPENVMGWLVAQGWEITGVTSDNTTVPPTAYYALAKQGMQPWQVLLSLCNSYTIAANDARDANELRYNEIVADWTEMITSSHDQFLAQTEEQNASAGVYLTDLNVYMASVEALIEENRTQIVADALTATTALEAMNVKLDDLETNAGDNATTVESLLSEQSDYLTEFLADFAAKLEELDTNYTDHLAVIEALIADTEVDLSTFAAEQAVQTAALSSAYTDLATELDGLLTTANTDLTNIAANIDAIVASLETDYAGVDVEVTSVLASVTAVLGDYVADYNAVLDLLETDYNAHVITATEFLTDLGATDLARINEKFQATLSVQLQALVDRGLYSSAIGTDITARNHRDRDEEIQKLNDRLMREKWENQHRLYGQQVDMRARTLDGKDRLHGVHQEVLRYQAAQIIGLYSLLQNNRDRTISAQTSLYQLREANTRLNVDIQTRLYDAGQAIRRTLIEEAARLAQLSLSLNQWQASQQDRLLEQVQQVVSQHISGIDRQYAAQQDVSRVAMSERDALLAQLQDAVRGIIAGKEQYSAALMRNASTLAEHKHRAIAEEMNSSVTRLEGWNRIAAENQRLLAYQLDTRNNLLIGLYSFVERRDDIAPRWEDMAQLIAGLGDAAGGWIQP